MFSIQSVFVEGRLNFGRVIVPDLVSSNGVVQVIDTMLIPPTAELGLTIYDRIARTPWLKVHEEILLLLGGFLLILIRAISMTACFVHRARPSSTARAPGAIHPSLCPSRRSARGSMWVT